MLALVEDLRAAGLDALAVAAAGGAFDAAKWESDAWLATPEGQQGMRDLESGALGLAQAVTRL